MQSWQRREKECFSILSFSSGLPVCEVFVRDGRHKFSRMMTRKWVSEFGREHYYNHLGIVNISMVHF